MTFFRRLLCRHDYRRVGNVLYRENRHYIVPKTKLVCRKCGAVIYK